MKNNKKSNSVVTWGEVFKGIVLILGLCISIGIIVIAVKSLIS